MYVYYYEVAPTQIIRQESFVFTYASEAELNVGQIVVVEVGRKQLPALVTRRVTRPAFDTKLVASVSQAPPIPKELVELALWMSGYYATHLALVLQTILPRGVLKTRRIRQSLPHPPLRDRTTNVFTQDQAAAIEQLSAMSSGSALLHGVTGSGKTAVYIELARRTLEHGQSVIVLVPEIALTSQLVDEFSGHFGDVILTHSRQTEAERHTAWLEALNSERPRVVIGPRSALFMPIPKLGLIVIDEAHEPSFKQEQSPRYSALRAASILAQTYGGKLIMGSATPLVADYYLAQASSRPIVAMSHLAQTGAVKPSVTLVDMTKRQSFKQHRFLSDKLLAQLAATFESGHQALIFHNRRGSASTTLCENCGWSAMCPRCFLPLTLHADKHALICHVCGFTDKVPTSCPVCASAEIIHKGIGTKLIESELKKIFPDKVIARFDGDSASDASVDARYKELYSGAIDLIIGTQVIAKGLDLPKLRTVGVIQADSGLALPDFGAPERTFQLLAQVIGRVGRSHHPTSVIVQSYQPTHPAVVDGLAQDYQHFYDTTLAERRHAYFPPFVYLLKLTCVYKTETAAIKNAKIVADDLRRQFSDRVEVLGPTPAFYERQRDTYRWQLVLKSKKRQYLLDVLQHVPSTHWQFELDPISLL